ncbi:MAG: 5'-nucleotidase C-terminal domain-containing protein, partial [Acidimicrobiales bacterium]
ANPERVQIQLAGAPLFPGAMSPPAAVKVGDRLEDITGVVGYSFGNYEVNAIEELVITDGGLAAETSKIEGKKDRVTVASYNVLNLSPDPSDDAQRAALADQIINALNSPDVIAVQEIQDDSGTTDDGTTSADETLQALVDAIAAAGGPSYSFFDVAPADGTSGGVPGGNIRNAFLYNSARVGLVDFVSLTPAELGAAGVTNTTAFTDTRHPLAATFEFNTHEFTVINNHLTSRFGSTPIFGGPQPFVQAGEAGGAGREDQVTALNEYVDHLLAGDDDARIMVVGDFNTFEWTNDLTELLPGAGDDRVLTNLVPTADIDDDDDDGDDDDGDHDGDHDDESALPDDAEYSFIFEGNSQMLDQFFVTDSLEKKAELDVVHLNVDFPRRFVDTVASDHEPLLASFKMKLPKDHVKLQLLTVSDWHGQLDPLFVFRQGSFGGAAELSTYFERERDNVKNTLTLTAGDAYGAAPPLSGFFDEEPSVRAMRMMGFDADTFGNHNFDQGIDHLQQMIDIANAGGSEPGESFQYVAANLENRDANLSGVKDFEMFEFQGVKVAVIGVVNPEAPTLVFPGSFGTIVITDPVAAAMDARAAAEAAGADVFVLLAHMGVTGAGPSGPLIDLANGVTGFDVIVGDHTDEEFSGVINGAIVVENQSKGRTYARIQLTYDKDAGAVVTSSANFVDPVSANVVPDQQIVDFLTPLRDQLNVLLAVVVGDSTVEIPRSDECGQSSGRTCESLVGDVVTDAMRDRYGTDFAITNSGGLRSPLTCPGTDIPGDFCNPGDEGRITRGQVLTVLPFGNSVVTLTVTGADLKDHLERGVSAMPGVSGRFAQVSGLCFSYDIEAPVGSRVLSAVRQAADGSCTGAAVDLTAASSYTLAENDFMASGGDGYPVDIGTAATRELLDQVTEAYVAANSPVSPAIEDRIGCVDPNPGVGNECPVPLP